MKLNHKKNKPKNKFDPIKHWHIILLGFFILGIIIVLYSVYSFFYIKREISIIEKETQNAVTNSTSTDSLEKSVEGKNFLNDINNLNKKLEVFKEKEIEYNRLIKSGIPAPSISTNTASNTVATSTN